MSSRIEFLAIAVALCVICTAETAHAGSASNAWGTGGPSSDHALRSATLHNLNDQIAEAVARAKTWNQSITSCGVCVYYQINGDHNSITGNSVTATNNGTVTSNGTYNNHYDFGW